MTMCDVKGVLHNDQIKVLWQSIVNRLHSLSPRHFGFTAHKSQVYSCFFLITVMNVVHFLK